MIRYSNATPAQVAYIENRIHNELPLRQTALIEALMRSEEGQRMGFDVDHITYNLVDPSDWTLEECREWVADMGHEPSCPNPWTMTVDELREALSDAGVEFSGKETPSDLRQILIDRINDEEIDGLDAWRDAARDCKVYVKLPKICEWWALANRAVADELRKGGEPVLHNDYGTWWGRSTRTEQRAVVVDPIFWVVFQNELPKGYAE